MQRKKRDKVNSENRYNLNNKENYNQIIKHLNEIDLFDLKEFDFSKIANDYILSRSVNKISITILHRLKRFLSVLFKYRYLLTIKRESDNKRNKVIFIFTGDAERRPDYTESFGNFIAPVENADIFMINRKRFSLSLYNSINFYKLLVWALQLFRDGFCLFDSLDISAFTYRAITEGYHLFKMIDINSVYLFVSFCDQWNIDSAITQMMKNIGIHTATLQHGSGDIFFYGSSSDYFLTTSYLHKLRGISCGLDPMKIIVVGPMRYIGSNFKYQKNPRKKNIGIVFDGGDNIARNLLLINYAQQVSSMYDMDCCYRLHPSIEIQEYIPFIDKLERVFFDLSSFLEAVDVCIVCDSSLYIDLVFKKIVSYRYLDSTKDLYPEISGEVFSDLKSLDELFRLYHYDYEKCIEKQKSLYKQIFGVNELKNQYITFLELIELDSLS